MLLRSSFHLSLRSEIHPRLRTRIESLDVTCKCSRHSNRSESVVTAESVLISFSKMQEDRLHFKRKSPEFALKQVPNQIYARYARAKQTCEPALG